MGKDREPDLPHDLQPPMNPEQRVSDFRLCRWELEADGFVFGAGEIVDESNEDNKLLCLNAYGVKM